MAQQGVLADLTKRQAEADQQLAQQRLEQALAGKVILRDKVNELALATSSLSVLGQLPGVERERAELTAKNSELMRQEEATNERIKQGMIERGTWQESYQKLLDGYLAKKAQELVIEEMLLKVQQARTLQAQAQSKAQEIATFGAGAKAGYRVGSGAAGVYEDMLRSNGADTAK